ncbi:MAG: hypothetical protein DDT42_01958 [candidate division WS2 bacterium]|uniref:Transposase IS4-like domain-containing protein n=1 Tax=Psychracetigena formicireducens TaxID=2986056 RepID=A0A9E2BN80_PSYF1|nr:hypothetical protein [Candidatus Psychracetigena formicireducens]
MRGSQARFDKDQACIKSSLFLSICRGFNNNYFTRKRKLTPENLTLSILNRKGVTLSMEIRRFFQLLKPKKIESISNPGYLKQRLKLSPATFQYLSDYHVRNFYEDEKNLHKLKGYYVFAVDGSKSNLPNTKETLGAYGGQVNQSGQQAQVGLSCLYDVFNKMVLDCTINPRNFSECAQVEIHIQKIPSIIEDQPFIMLLDRGYPSSLFFINRLESNQKFVVRLSSKDFKQEQINMTTDDEDVEIKFTPQRIGPYRKTVFAKRLREKQSIHLRFVKIMLPDGVVEVLATNLQRNEFSAEEIGKLYGLRWEIETAYGNLKNKFMLENYTGKKPVIIEQDILSTIYLYNLVQDIIRDAEEERQEKDKHKQYKHKMTINLNIAIGIIKEDLIRMALEDDPGKRGEIFNDIIRSIANNLVPVRKSRQFQRKRKHPSIKHPITKKRSY